MTNHIPGRDGSAVGVGEGDESTVKRGRFTGSRLMAVLFIILLTALPFVLAPYHLAMVTNALIWCIFATGYNIVFGWGGMPALGHAAFYGSGAYVMAIVFEGSSLPVAVAIVLALAVGGLLGALFGIVVWRVSGVYLLLLTLVVAQSLLGLVFYFSKYTRGDMGIFITRTADTVFASDIGEFVVVAVLLLVILAAVTHLGHTALGLAIKGVRDSEARVKGLGYSAVQVKIYAFMISGAIAGLAGALHAMHVSFVGSQDMEWLVSATVLLMVIVGGARSATGPLIGAAIVIFLETALSDYTDRWMTILGVIYILVALLLPDGITGRFRAARPPQGGSASLGTRRRSAGAVRRAAAGGSA